MKVTELKIGDWVSIFHKPYQVEAINCSFIEATGYGRCWLEDLEPINLTSDILIKNGWKLDDTRAYDRFDDGNTTIYEKGPGTFDVWLDNEKNLPRYIHYVHDFQNVLSILGYNDLGIKLQL